MQSGEQSKVDPMSRSCIWLGLESGVKDYRLWDPVSTNKIVSKDVFDKAYMLEKGENKVSTNRQKRKQVAEAEFDD